MIKQWVIKLLRKFGFYGTLDTEKALREKNKEILELKHEVERLRGYVIVAIDPAMKAKAYEQSAWNSPPERTTGPVQGIRRRAMTREFQEHPGILMQHHKEMQKKAQTVKLDPETVILPITKQPSKPRLHRLYAEPDSTFNAL